ncbi:MAG: hypothetical protein AB8G16_18905 [Gammaproteobacteria bacterium]
MTRHLHTFVIIVALFTGTSAFAHDRDTAVRNAVFDLALNEAGFERAHYSSQRRRAYRSPRGFRAGRYHYHGRGRGRDAYGHRHGYNHRYYRHHQARYGYRYSAPRYRRY